MALCSLTTRKMDIPHEPGEWVEVRPLSATVLRDAIRAVREQYPNSDDPEYGYELTQRMLRLAVVSWSYDATPSAETIGDLDLKTTSWLAEELFAGGGEVPLPITSPSTESSAETAKA